MTRATGQVVVDYDASLSTAGGNRVETRRFTATRPPTAPPRRVGPALNRAANQVAPKSPNGSAARAQPRRGSSTTCSNTSFDRPGVATIRSSACAHHRGALRLEPPPAAERRHQPRRDLRIELVGGDDHVGEEGVAAPVGASGTPSGWRRTCPASERSRLGLVDREIGMLRELQHLVDRVGALRRGLQREPFVEHQRVVVEALVEGVERRLPLGRVERDEHAERALAVGHVVGARRTAPWRAPPPARVVGRGEQAQRDRAQPADALGARATGRRPRRRRCGARRAARPTSAAPIAARSASRAAWIASGSTTSIRSAIRLSLGSRIASALNAGSSALDLSVARDRADHRLGIDRLAARAGDQRAHHQLLHRLVAGERVGVGLRQPLELVRRGARPRR